ncbi:MAG: prolyl oligopeptidase family serine peptidase [Granulosicoccus sp.]|nr:prolyl oligopeptidase family serine peptidase [Granulosicoccus sp.]
MINNKKMQAPYGSWSSPISAESLVRGTLGISEVIPEPNGVWWAESRPDEGGRIAVMHHSDGITRQVTPTKSNVRTTVHEYGGGAWWAHAQCLWFVEYEDQRIYQLPPSGSPRPLTPKPEKPGSLRYADMRPTADANWLISVCERHTSNTKEPENLLIATACDGSQQQIELVTGADFYGSVSLSPDGCTIAWIQWNHPNMPWDNSQLMCATLTTDATKVELHDIRCIAGGNNESVIQPLFSEAGILHYLSDKNDYWHLYSTDSEAPVLCVDGEIGYPPWVHGLSRYTFDDDNQVVAAYFNQGIDHLPGFPELTDFKSVRSSGGKLAFAGASWQQETAVYYNGEQIRTAGKADLDPAYLTPPEIISFPTGDKHSVDTAHALYFKPANPDFEAAPNEKPPLIVLAHGGPTSAARPYLSLAQRFWTSRGFAVVDVNYRGSSGYGRSYRKKLEGQWGVADVQDCVAAAQYLVDRNEVDEKRLIIRGGSAGGFTVLTALAMHDVFTAGACLYGVADLEALAEDTHKFESRYLDTLIGPWPEQADLYKKRSPINHLDGFSAPMIVLQGSEDLIVPPNQSRMIVEAVDDKGLPVAYLEFEGEQHGFRKADTIVRATLSELSFYGRVFGFVPAGETVELDIRNLS